MLSLCIYMLRTNEDRLRANPRVERSSTRRNPCPPKCAVKVCQNSIGIMRTQMISALLM